MMSQDLGILGGSSPQRIPKTMMVFSEMLIRLRSFRSLSMSQAISCEQSTKPVLPMNSSLSGR